MTTFTVDYHIDTNGRRHLSIDQESTEHAPETTSVLLRSTLLGFGMSIQFGRIEDLQQLVLRTTGMLAEWMEELEQGEPS